MSIALASDINCQSDAKDEASTIGSSVVIVQVMRIAKTWCGRSDWGAILEGHQSISRRKDGPPRGRAING